MIPLPLLANAKLIGAAVLAVVISIMAVTIYIMSNRIETLNSSLAASEANNKVLNTTIENQNSKIIEANAKFEQVQKQLHIANGTNRKLAESFKELKGDINSRPLPKDCGAAISEMIDTGKKVQKTWKK